MFLFIVGSCFTISFFAAAAVAGGVYGDVGDVSQINGVCLSPTNPKHKRIHASDLKRTKSQGTRLIQKAFSTSSASLEESDIFGGASLLCFPLLFCQILSLVIIL